MRKINQREIWIEGFIAGVKATGEGFNGEYPYLNDDELRSIAEKERTRFLRELT